MVGHNNRETQMKQILFLDDNIDRHEGFRTLVPSDRAEVTYVTTAAECIDKLRGKVWDIVFLDHDLGGEVYVQTSRRIAVWRWSVCLLRRGAAHGIYVVLSWNDPAAVSMVEGLKGMGFDVVRAKFLSREFRLAVEQLLQA